MFEKLSSHSNNKDEASKSLWIFGYGSLIWKPDFPFEYCVVGHIEGFTRRFWQGSTWHRGDTKQPGRVVTLVEDKQGQVWGMAFKVAKEHVERAMGNLHEREIAVGGYELRRLRFNCNENPSHSFHVLAYAATPKNSLYLGPATTEELAVQIASARGQCGLNVEYLVRLADFMREKVPHYHEEHLFELEKLVRKELGLSTEISSSWTQLRCALV